MYVCQTVSYTIYRLSKMPSEALFVVAAVLIMAMLFGFTGEMARIFFCILAGLFSGVLIGKATEYFTSSQLLQKHGLMHLGCLQNCIILRVFHISHVQDNEQFKYVLIYYTA